jgi:hypothetical protein
MYVTVRNVSAVRSANVGKYRLPFVYATHGPSAAMPLFDVAPGCDAVVGVIPDGNEM